MELQHIESFIGWCTVINIAILLLSTILIAALRKPIMRIHTKILPLSEEELLKAYFHYLAIYKIGIILFNLTPYIALILMG